MSEEPRERRDYLRTVLGIVAGLAVGGVSSWLAKPREVETIWKTITERKTVISQPPATTITVPERITERITETVTKTVTPTPTPTPTLTETVTTVTPIPTPTPTPTEKVFTYKADDFELKVTVPSYMSLSTPDDKKPARLNIYLKMAEALSGLFSVDIEFGIKIRLPVFGLYAFVDTDLHLPAFLGGFIPDVKGLCFEYPIYGLPTEVMSLESGDVGVYALAVPVKVAEVELESLTVGEWYHVGSYDLYVVEEQNLVALGIPAEDVTIGEVEKV